MTGWGKVDDVAMTDADQDGVFEGAFKVKVTANICSINQITLENHLCEVLDYFKDENKFDVSKMFMLLLVSPQGNGL